MCLETVRLTGAISKPEAIRTLWTLVESVDKADGLQRLCVLRHARILDLCVFLQWGENVPPEGSTIGLLFAELLSEYGSVDHAVWNSSDSPSHTSPRGAGR